MKKLFLILLLSGCTPNLTGSTYVGPSPKNLLLHKDGSLTYDACMIEHSYLTGTINDKNCISRTLKSEA